MYVLNKNLLILWLKIMFNKCKNCFLVVGNLLGLI